LPALLEGSERLDLLRWRPNAQFSASSEHKEILNKVTTPSGLLISRSNSVAIAKDINRSESQVVGVPLFWFEKSFDRVITALRLETP
jgi:hypothetical protein